MYKIWKLYVETHFSYRVRTKELTKFKLWPWPLDPKIYRCLPLTTLHLYAEFQTKYECCMLKKYSSYLIRTKVLTKFKLWPWPFTFWPHFVENYLSYFVRTKYCQSSVVTLTFELQNLSLPCIYIWNMKAVNWKILKLLCQNQSVDKVQLWPRPLNLDIKVYRYLLLAILHLCMKYESCATLKTTQVNVSDPKCWQTDGQTDGQTWFL